MNLPQLGSLTAEQAFTWENTTPVQESTLWHSHNVHERLELVYLLPYVREITQ